MRKQYCILIFRLLFFAAILAVYVISWIVQSKLLLNCDVSWFLYGAQKILIKGGNYIHDFMEYNPPLILYLSYLPTFVSYHFHISLIVAFRLYIFLLTTLSLCMCYYFVRQIFSKNMLLGFLFLLLMAVGLLIFPAYDFGQREHLFIILVMPYLFSVAYHLENRLINPFFALFIGLLAGIAFAIKIFFVIMLLTVEVYYLLCNKKWNSFVRVETAMIMFVFILYLALSFLLHPDYYSFIIPLLHTNYFNRFRDFSDLLFHPATYFFLITAVLYWVRNKKCFYDKLNSVLFFALMGCWLFYLIQQTNYIFHYYPLIFLATMLTMLVLFSFFLNSGIRLFDGVFILLFAAVIWYIPFAILKVEYQSSMEYSKNYKHLISYLRQNMQHKSLYVFTSSAQQTFPIVQYADVNYFSRFSSLEVIFGAVNLSLQEKNRQMFFTNIVIDEIRTNKPDFILVDVRKFKPYLTVGSVDYVKYFFKYPSFQEVWKKYRYLTTIEQSPLNLGYQFQVYQRV